VFSFSSLLLFLQAPPFKGIACIATVLTRKFQGNFKAIMPDFPFPVNTPFVEN